MALGALISFIITSFVWARVTDREQVGDLRVDKLEDGKPVLYLAMNENGMQKIKKGKYVSFYVQNDPELE